MPKREPDEELQAFEQGVKELKGRKYVLKLYIAGNTPKSNQAILNVKRICEEHLKGRYDLEVIDVYQQPVLAKGEQIIAAPTLIKKLPPPLRRLIGTMAETERVLLGLDIRPKEELSRKSPRAKEKEDGRRNGNT